MFGQNDMTNDQNTTDPAMVNTTPMQEYAQDIPTDTGHHDMPNFGAYTPATEPTVPNISANNNGAPAGDSTADLQTIKQKAVAELTPLVGQLDQSPQEKFNTVMTIIRATDNQSMLPGAYQAAQNITDSKTRAQALLDIINEINYFTHNSDNVA